MDSNELRSPVQIARKIVNDLEDHGRIAFAGLGRSPSQAELTLSIVFAAIEADRAERPDIDEVTANRILNGAQGWVGSAVDRERMERQGEVELAYVLAEQTENRRANFIEMVHKLAGKTTEGQEN